ncbi:MAG TPA: hypothetical protein VGB52_08540 [Actinomycetota bacterium]
MRVMERARAARPPRGPDGPRSTDGARAVLALARVEGRRLLRNPAFVAFGALTILALRFTDGEVTDLNQAYWIGLVFFPICAGVLLATNLATLRARRTGCEELFGVTGASDATRTTAHALAGVHAFIAGVVLLVAWVIIQRAGGAIGWPDPLEALMGPVLILGAAATGVMLARLIPSPLAALPGIVVIAMVTGQLNSMDGHAYRFEWLAPWPGTNDGLPPEAWPRPTGAHLVYLLALAVLIGAIAVLRRARGRGTIAVAVSAALLAGATGWEHSRPPSERELATAVAWLTDPDHRCIDEAGARLCVYPGYEQLLETWSAAIVPVLAEAPAAVRARSLLVEQLPSQAMFETIPRAVRDRLPARVLDGSWRRDGALHPDFGWSAGPMTSIAMSARAASWAVGLPLEQTTRPVVAEDFEGDEPVDDRFTGVRVGDAIPTPCFAGGRARAVVALWLTGVAHGGPSTFDAAFNDDADDGMSSGAPDSPEADHLDITPPSWTTELPQAVIWATSDLRYAFALLERPNVGDAIRARWAFFTHPTTTSEQLARALSLPLQPRAAAAPGAMPICR